MMSGRLAGSSIFRLPRPERVDPAVPLPRSYWVEPGNLLVGAFPGDPDPSVAEVKLLALREAGISVLLSLLDPNERATGGKKFVPYHPCAAGLGMKCNVLPLARESSLNTAAMTGVLDYVDSCLQDGQAIYVHCYGGRGRSAAVAGCWLVRHGAAPESVISQLASLRAGCPDSEALVPETTSLREGVLAWHVGR